MQERSRRVGILAGGGILPLELARHAMTRGCLVQIVAIDGEADADFGGLPVTRVNWGQIGGMVSALKAARAEDLLIVGRVRRPDLMKLKTDLGFFVSLPAILRIIASGGDDSVLRKVVRFFESHGLRVLSPADVAPELVVGEGPLGRATPSTSDTADIARGFALVRALGAFDIGQSVIVSGGSVVAVEGAEGTDGMLERVGGRKVASAAALGGVLVKRTKPGQDLRVDMPAIGPQTVARATGAGLQGIAVEAGRVLVADKAETIRGADAAGVFVVGCSDDGKESVEGCDATPNRCSGPFVRLGRIGPGHGDGADIAKGAAVVEMLAQFKAGHAAVVARRHVLAVEAGEGVPAMIERASRLKQWGRMSRRRGVAVLASANDLTVDLVHRAAAAGLAGLSVIRGSYAEESTRNALASADHLGLFVAGRHDDEGVSA